MLFSSASHAPSVDAHSLPLRLRHLHSSGLSTTTRLWTLHHHWLPCHRPPYRLRHIGTWVRLIVWFCFGLPQSGSCQGWPRAARHIHTHTHPWENESERARDSARTRAWVWVRASACEWERRGQCWARLELILFFLIFLVSSLCVTVPWPGPAPPPPTRSPGRRHSALPSL